MATVLKEKKVVNVYYTSVGYLVFSKGEALRYGYIDDIFVDYPLSSHVIRLLPIEDFLKKCRTIIY